MGNFPSKSQGKMKFLPGNVRKKQCRLPDSTLVCGVQCVVCSAWWRPVRENMKIKRMSGKIKVVGNARVIANVREKLRVWFW